MMYSLLQSEMHDMHEGDELPDGSEQDRTAEQPEPATRHGFA